MKKLINLLSLLTISGVVPLIESSCSNKNNEKKIKKDDENDINKLNLGNLGIEKRNRVKRNAIINNKYQHVFKTNGSNKPTEQQIKEEIIKLNPQLDIKNINVTNITENSAVITIANFSGQKTINFKVETNTSNNEPFVSSPSPNDSYDDDDVLLNCKVEKINSPAKIIAKDIKNVTEEELITALLPKIYEEYDRINPRFYRKNSFGIKDYILYDVVKIKNINFPIDLSSEKIINNFFIEGRFIYKILPIFRPVFYLEIPNFKLPAAQLI